MDATEAVGGRISIPLSIGIPVDEAKRTLRERLAQAGVTSAGVEKMIDADDSITVIMPPVSPAIAGPVRDDRVPANTMFLFAIEMMEEYARNQRLDLARYFPILAPPNKEDEKPNFLILWPTDDQRRIWQEPVNAAVQAFATIKYPNLDAIAIKHTFPSATRGKFSGRPTVTIYAISAWEARQTGSPVVPFPPGGALPGLPRGKSLKH